MHALLRQQHAALLSTHNLLAAQRLCLRLHLRCRSTRCPALQRTVVGAMAVGDHGAHMDDAFTLQLEGAEVR